MDTTKDLSLIGTEPNVAISIWVKSQLDTYSSVVKYTEVVFDIQAVTCNCAALVLANPSASVTVGSTVFSTAATSSAQVLGMPAQDNSAITTNTALAKCYESGGTCSADGSVTSI